MLVEVDISIPDYHDGDEKDVIASKMCRTAARAIMEAGREFDPNFSTTIRDEEATGAKVTIMYNPDV